MKIHREIFGLIFLWLFSYGVRAQDERFIYFQSDHQQPFYVKTENRVYSSSESGYVIIYSIPEGHVFNFTLGFPKNIWPSQQFTIDPLQKDMGFRLTQTDSSNWALYDFQSGNMLLAVSHSQVQGRKMILIVDEFTNVLAEVSHTPSLREKRLKTEISLGSNVSPSFAEGNSAIVHQVVQTNDTGLQANNNLTQHSVNTEQPLAPLSTIRKQTEYITDSGRVIQYVVTEGEQISTIDVLIPVDNIIQATENSNLIQAINSDTSAKFVNKDSLTSIVSVVADTFSVQHIDAAVMPSDDTKYLVANVNDVKLGSLPTIATTIISDRDSVLTFQNMELVPVADTSNANAAKIAVEIICSTAATEKDIIELRRTMVKEDDEGKMLTIAGEAMKEKCFYTEQLRNLAVLFLNEDNRLSYLVSSYRYCIDKEKYTSLSSLLNQEKNINTFKEQIH